MAWFRNHYICASCHSEWQDEWSAMCDDDCPECGARHMSPVTSDDLTEVIEPEGADYVVLRSPNTAEYDPQYCEQARFSTRRAAEAFLRT